MRGMKKIVALAVVALHAMMSASGAAGDSACDAPPMPSASSYETTNAANGTVTKTFLAADGKTVTGRYSFRLETKTNEIIYAASSTLPNVPRGTAWVKTGPDAYECQKFSFMPKLKLDTHGGISAVGSDGKEYVAYGFCREEPWPVGWMCSGPLYNSQKEIDSPNPHFRIKLVLVDDEDLETVRKTGREPWSKKVAARLRQLEQTQKARDARDAARRARDAK